MNREHESEELIELGTASVETRGLAAGTDDHSVGLIKREGLTED